jgi:hypothetical protein
MPLSANPAARSALAYITIGSLMDVWAGVWYWYMRSMPDGNRDGTWWYICIGLLLSGAVLIVIGLLIGRIGREARHADAPPATPLDAQTTANARIANANAAIAANVAANPPADGTAAYMVPTPMPALAPMGGNPIIASAAVPTTAPPAPGTRQHKV